MAVRAHLFKIDGRVLGGMQFGVLVQARAFLRLDGLTQGNAVWGAGAEGAVGRSLGNGVWRG